MFTPENVPLPPSCKHHNKHYRLLGCACTSPTSLCQNNASELDSTMGQASKQHKKATMSTVPQVEGPDEDTRLDAAMLSPRPAYQNTFYTGNMTLPNMSLIDVAQHSNQYEHSNVCPTQWSTIDQCTLSNTANSIIRHMVPIRPARMSDRQSGSSPSHLRAQVACTISILVATKLTKRCALPEAHADIKCGVTFNNRTKSRLMQQILLRVIQVRIRPFSSPRMPSGPKPPPLLARTSRLTATLSC